MKKTIKMVSWPIVSILALSIVIYSCQNSGTPVYKNSEYSIDERTHDLISRMTIEEKVAQTIAIWSKLGMEGKFSPDTSDFNAKYGIGAIHRRYVSISCRQVV